MRLMIFILLVVTLQNAAKANTIDSAASSFTITADTIRGGHPSVMKMLWADKITLSQAASIENCIGELSSDTSEVLDIDVTVCIKENK